MRRNRKALAAAVTVVTLAGVGGFGALIGAVVKNSNNPLPKNCFRTPGKMWGGKFHYSHAILKPTVYQYHCLYSSTGNTSVFNVVSVTVGGVNPIIGAAVSTTTPSIP